MACPDTDLGLFRKRGTENGTASGLAVQSTINLNIGLHDRYMLHTYV